MSQWLTPGHRNAIKPRSDPLSRLPRMFIAAVASTVPSLRISPIADILRANMSRCAINPESQH